jgi:SPP1 gp7 family putative phage head morphogenesis protein
VKFDLASRITANGKRPSKRPIKLANNKPTQAQMLALLALYAKIVALWAAAAPKIVEAYQADLDSTTGNAGAAQAVIREASASAASLILLTVPLVGEWAVRLEKVQQGKWVSSILSTTGVDVSTLLAPTDVSALVKASADWNAALIKDISSEAERRISNIVYAGLQAKTSRYDIAKEIAKSTGMSRRRARSIAVDQTNKLQAALNRARREQAGIVSYIWRHSQKLHARPAHLARNGKVFKNDDPRIPNGDRCGEPPFCGCSEQAFVTFDDQAVAR